MAREALWETFCELHKSPYFMQELIRELMLKRAKTLKEALGRIQRNIMDNPELSGRWAALNELEKAVFLKVEDEVSLYSSEVLQELAREIDTKEVTSGQVQNVVRQLIKKGYIGATGRRGAYRIEDPELRTWLDGPFAAFNLVNLAVLTAFNREPQ